MCSPDFGKLCDIRCLSLVSLLSRYSSSCFLAALGDMTVTPSSSTERFSSNVTESEDANVCEDYTEGDCGSGSVDDSKMTRVCDKLIEVFMVDKPTTTDWRRLLAFSKEWSNIRPHFYQRCEERADREGDPGMKHKLLRLGRKLKEVILHFYGTLTNLQIHSFAFCQLMQ